MVVLVDDKLHEVHVDEGEVFLDVYVDFLLGHGDEVVEVLEGFVDGVEELPGVGDELFAAFDADKAEVVLVHDEFVESRHFVGYGLVGRHFVLLPFAAYFVAGALDEADVVFRVVEC